MIITSSPLRKITNRVVEQNVVHYKTVLHSIKDFLLGEIDLNSISFKQVVQSVTKPLASTVHLVSLCLIGMKVFDIYIISLIYPSSKSKNLVSKW